MHTFGPICKDSVQVIENSMEMGKLYRKLPHIQKNLLIVYSLHDVNKRKYD